MRQLSSCGRRRLLASGFSSWSKQQYQAFIRASARHGRTALEQIAAEVLGKTLGEVRRYCENFWRRGCEYLCEFEWERCLRAVEKGERRLDEIETLMAATRRFVQLSAGDVQLRFAATTTPAHTGGSNQHTATAVAQLGSQHTGFVAADEERVLLIALAQHGHGQWRAIRAALHAAPELRFDWCAPTSNDRYAICFFRSELI